MFLLCLGAAAVEALHSHQPSPVFMQSFRPHPTQPKATDGLYRSLRVIQSSKMHWSMAGRRGEFLLCTAASDRTSQGGVLSPLSPCSGRQIGAYGELLFSPFFFSKCMEQPISTPSQKWSCIKVTLFPPSFPSGGQKIPGLQPTEISRSHHRYSWPLLSFTAVASPTTFYQKMDVEHLPWWDRVLGTHWAQVALVSAQGTLRSG